MTQNGQRRNRGFLVEVLRAKIAVLHELEATIRFHKSEIRKAKEQLEQEHAKLEDVIMDETPPLFEGTTDAHQI